jgi:splicing factor 1
MAWRNQGITGSNNIPLGTRRRIGGDNNDDGGYNPAEPSTGINEMKRGRSPTRDGRMYHLLALPLLEPVR